MHQAVTLETMMDAGFRIVEQKELPVYPPRDSLLVARKAWKAEDHATLIP